MVNQKLFDSSRTQGTTEKSGDSDLDKSTSLLDEKMPKRWSRTRVKGVGPPVYDFPVPDPSVVTNHNLRKKFEDYTENVIHNEWNLIIYYIIFYRSTDDYSKQKTGSERHLYGYYQVTILSKLIY